MFLLAVLFNLTITGFSYRQMFTFKWQLNCRILVDCHNIWWPHWPNAWTQWMPTIDKLKLSFKGNAWRCLTTLDCTSKSNPAFSTNLNHNFVQYFGLLSVKKSTFAWTAWPDCKSIAIALISVSPNFIWTWKLCFAIFPVYE